MVAPAALSAGLPAARHRVSPAGRRARRAQRRCPSPAGRLGQRAIPPGRAQPRISTPRIKAGSTLLREWHGRTYTVLALDEGFEMAGSALPPSRRSPATSLAPIGPDLGSSASAVRPGTVGASPRRPQAGGAGRCVVGGAQANRRRQDWPALRDLHPQVDGGGAGAGVQLARCPARGLRGLCPQPAPRGLVPAPARYDDVARFRRQHGPAGAAAPARRCRIRAGRL